MPAKSELPQEEYSAHRILATQVETLYVEINKLATKKPTERIAPLISKKLNHVLFKIRSQVLEDEFLDAIDTLPVEGEQVRLDEALIVLGELKGVLDRQWNSQVYRCCWRTPPERPRVRRVRQRGRQTRTAGSVRAESRRTRRPRAGS